MIQRVRTLFTTLLRIIFFRDGPEAIPNSPFLLVIVTACWLLTSVAALAILDSYHGVDLLIDMLIALAGIAFYSIVVTVFERRDRLLSCLSAILGCGVIFTLALFALRLVLPDVQPETAAGIFLQLIWFWSIPVEGHIIARTIDRPWVIGFLFAIAVLIGQLQLFAILKPALVPAA